MKGPAPGARAGPGRVLLAPPRKVFEDGYMMRGSHPRNC